MVPSTLQALAPEAPGHVLPPVVYHAGRGGPVPGAPAGFSTFTAVPHRPGDPRAVLTVVRLTRSQHISRAGELTTQCALCSTDSL